MADVPVNETDAGTLSSTQTLTRSGLSDSATASTLQTLSRTKTDSASLSETTSLVKYPLSGLELVTVTEDLYVFKTNATTGWEYPLAQLFTAGHVANPPDIYTGISTAINEERTDHIDRENSGGI